MKKFEDYRIPFNRPCFQGRELQYIERALSSGKISGDGEFTKRCQTLLEQEVGTKRAFLTTSCTDALEMTALLLDIQPGDEVVMPSFTFVSTANAYVLRGARPVFVDIREDTLNIDEGLIAGAITPRTKAIVPVHYGGVGCELDVIVELANERHIAVVEDNAQGLFGRFKGQALGTFGAMATLSFHETKNYTCGEGGALLVNEESLIERAEILWEKGTNRRLFYRGEVDRYTWVDLGSSFLPSDVIAAFLLAQLECRETIQNKRREIWETYQRGLAKWAADNSVRIPTRPSYCDSSYHMFCMILPSRESRDGLIRFLAKRGILAVFHYVPLHLSDMGRRLNSDKYACPVTEQLSARLVRLPFFNDLPLGMQQEVISAVVEFNP